MRPLLLLLALFTAAALAPSPLRPAAALASPAPRVVIDFRDAPLEDVLRWMADLTGRRFLLSADAQNHRITWIAPRPRHPRPGPGTHSSSRSPPSTSPSPARAPSGASPPPAAPPSTRALSPSSTPTRACSRPCFARLCPPSARVLPDPTQNRLLLLDLLPAQRQRLLTLIRALDRPGQDAHLYLIQLQHADAQQLAPLLQQLAR
jgi:type II secretory pathway component GspD/PulD (secretin)